MGALFQSIAQGAGRAGNELAEAKTANLDQKQRTQQFALMLQELQGRLKQQGIQQKTEVAPQVVHSYKGSDGKVHNLIRDPMTGKVTDQVAEGSVAENTGLDQKKADLEKLLGRKLTDEETQILGGLMPKPPSGQTEYEKKTDEYKADKELRKSDPQLWRELHHPPHESGGDVSIPEKRLKALADKWHKEGIKPPSKYQAQVEEYMQDHDMNAKVKMTADEAKASRQFKQIEPMIGRMAEIFEQNPGLQEQGRGGLTSWGAWTARAKTEKAWQEYSHGLPPSDKTLGELIRRAAAIKVMGAAPWMSIGRGKYMYQEIVQHLPATNDTPAQLFDKLQFYRDILQDAKDALPSQGGEDLIPGEVIQQ